MVYPTPSDPSTNEQQNPLQTASTTNLTPHTVGDPLTEGEVIRIELYEEVPNLNRETVVQEIVQIKKISTQEAADLQP